MSVSDHFRTHGTVHFLWTIAILIAVIAGLLVYLPNGALLRDYLSFASSVASIVLAVVAIFYSMFSNQSFSEMVGSLQASVRRNESSSTNLIRSTSEISSLAEQISANLQSLGPRFESVESKIEQRLLPGSSAVLLADESDRQKEEASFLASQATYGLGVGLYIIKKMHETGRSFNCQEAFDTDIWRFYVSGCLSTLGSVQPCGLKIDRAGKYTFKLSDLGTLTISALEREIETSKPSNKMIKLVDEAFDINGTDDA